MYTHAMPPLEQVWYLYYYFKKGSPDYLTHQLMDFKDDHVPQVNAFAELAGETVKRLRLRFDYIVRVLGSNELSAAQPNRVGSIAMAIEQAVGGVYAPDLLTKKRHTKSLKGLKLAERKAELKDVYVLGNRINLDGMRVLIVDDITTTGTSLKVIAVLIKTRYPKARVSGFLLAKTFGHDFGDPSENPSKSELHYKEILAKHLPK